MSRSGQRFLVAAVLVAAILLTALSVHALWTPWSGGTRPAADSVPRGAVTLTGGTAHDVVTLTVSAPVTGVTAVDVRVTSRDAARRSSPVVTVSATLPTAGHATPDLPAVRGSGDSYHVARLPLMMPGRWEFLVVMDGDGRRERLVFPLTVLP